MQICEFRTIVHPVSLSQTGAIMAQFSQFIGRRVQVQYQAGNNLVPAIGVLVADSGRSVFLEEHFARHTGVKQFRWEIPYQCILHMDDEEPMINAIAAD